MDAELIHFFNPLLPVDITNANLPHWRQDHVCYFITFRLVDSIPQERLCEWKAERDAWLERKRRDAASTLSEDDRREYHERFTARLEQWLDQGVGSCILSLSECRSIVGAALTYFDQSRYALGEHVVAANHVHALVRPYPGNSLSDILHSWKSYTAKQLVKVEAASRRLSGFWCKSGRHSVWQKESYDHIVRSEASLKAIEQYVRKHPEWTPE